MNNIINYIINYILNFNVYTIMIKERMILAFFIEILISLFFILIYLRTIYVIKKSDKALKIISQQHNVFQRILCIHYYKNIYKKVDRLYFNIIYHFYHFQLILFAITFLSIFISIIIPIFNQISCVLIYLSIFIILSTEIVAFFSLTDSPTGGVEFRGEKKYRGKKNW